MNRNHARAGARPGLFVLCLAVTTAVAVAAPEAPAPAPPRPAAPAAPAPELTGYYASQTEDGEGGWVGGVVLIRPAGRVYQVLALCGATPAAGVGMLQGDRLSVGWASGPAGVGVTVYRVRGDGVLEGRWTQVPPGVTRREVLTRLPGAGE